VARLARLVVFWMRRVDRVGRFKRFGDLLVVAPPRKAVEEVS
jgi:hypothetical protein